MFEIITDWLTEDLQNLLGSYTAPTVSALVVGSWRSWHDLCFHAPCIGLAASLFDK